MIAPRAPRRTMPGRTLAWALARALPPLLAAAFAAGCAPTPGVRPPAAAIPVLLIPPPALPAPPDKAAAAALRCPTAADLRRLRAARPRPLRTQPMPASPAERVARTAAQLGLYEARGAWADQVEEVLARCDAD